MRTEQVSTQFWRMPADKGRKQKVKSTKKLRLFGGQRADWVQNSHNSRQTQWAGVEAKSPGSQGLLRRKMPSNPCFKGHIHVPIIMHVIVQLMCLLFKSVFHFEKKIIFYILIIRNYPQTCHLKKGFYLLTIMCITFSAGLSWVVLLLVSPKMALCIHANGYMCGQNTDTLPSWHMSSIQHGTVNSNHHTAQGFSRTHSSYAHESLCLDPPLPISSSPRYPYSVILWICLV